MYIYINIYKDIYIYIYVYIYPYMKLTHLLIYLSKSYLPIFYLLKGTLMQI